MSRSLNFKLCFGTFHVLYFTLLSEIYVPGKVEQLSRGTSEEISELVFLIRWQKVFFHLARKWRKLCYEFEATQLVAIHSFFPFTSRPQGCNEEHNVVTLKLSQWEL